jgi:UDP-N-acetylmuramoyl-L-alanyl-D-glutamate--2,6-diaminopimelate ligase
MSAGGASRGNRGDAQAERSRRYDLHVRLSVLLDGVPGARLARGGADADISLVTHDSRRVRPGSLFLAIRGDRFDGRRFIPDALSSGASAIATDDPTLVDAAPIVVLVPDARPALADLAASFHGHPSRRQTLVGITGTDGKTTTTHLSSAILERAGLRTGWLTTVDAKIADRRRANDLHHTTPEADRVQELLAEMVGASVDVAILETSSHALSLDRVRACEFDAAVFTNLTPEHLNFHGTMEAYASAKASLFARLGDPTTKTRPRFGVVNSDDPYAATMIAACPVDVITYAIDAEAEFRARDVRVDDTGIAFELVSPIGSTRVASRLLGRFNVLNWLAAAATATRLGATLERVAQAAAELAPIDGRMERVDLGQPFAVVVDFSHTPGALENALRELRSSTRGKLMVAFGQAGERDPANRPAMGELATRLANYFVITMDDPLHEDPLAIAAEIVRGATVAGGVEGRDFHIQLDRASAIRELFDRARPGDTVLLAGKGHERRMLVGDERLAWNDREAAIEALRERGWG